MRWKLLLIASFVAATVGAGTTLGIAYGLPGMAARLTAEPINVVLALLVPVAATTIASIFVYRHTARRRALQALLTALLAAVLTLTAIILGQTLFSPPAATLQIIPPQTTPRNVV